MNASISTPRVRWARRSMFCCLMSEPGCMWNATSPDKIVLLSTIEHRYVGFHQVATKMR